MKYESEKKRRIRERQRMKKEKEIEDDECVMDYLKANTRVVSRKEAEDAGKRMYDEAYKKIQLKKNCKGNVKEERSLSKDVKNIKEFKEAKENNKSSVSNLQTQKQKLYKFMVGILIKFF